MSSDRPSVPYVVKYPWYMKIIGLLCLGVIVFFLIPNPRPPALELWERWNTFFRLLMVVSVVIVSAGIAEIFFFRMIFSASGIERRSKFLRTVFTPYSEVKVKYRPETYSEPAFLIITFSDLHTIKISDGLANLQTVGGILVTYGNKVIMTTPKQKFLKIYALLANEHDQLARVCEEILRSGSPSVTSFDLPLKNTRDIYYRRAELNAAQGDWIRGFHTLVQNLVQETEPTVSINSVIVGEHEFVMFSTSDLSRLIGLLVFPPRVSASVQNDLASKKQNFLHLLY